MKTTQPGRQASRHTAHTANPALAERGASLSPPAYGIDFADRGPGGGGSPASLPAPGPGGGAAVIQRWPKWLDRLLGRNPHQRLESDDDRQAKEVKNLGHRAQARKEAIEAQRSDKVGEGLGQVAEEGLKMGLDAATLPTTGVPVGTLIGVGRSAQAIAASGHKAHRETGRKGSTAKAVGKEVLKEGMGEALGNIPVVGEFIGMGQGLATAATGAFESEASRGKAKQKAIDAALSERDLAEQARQRLADGELEAANRRRLEKGVKRHETALASGHAWQQGKAKKGVLPLLSAEGPDADDELLPGF